MSKIKVRVGDCIWYSVDKGTKIGLFNYNRMKLILNKHTDEGYIDGQLIGVHPQLPLHVFGVDLEYAWKGQLKKAIHVVKVGVPFAHKLRGAVRMGHGALNLMALVLSYAHGDDSSLYKETGKRLRKMSIPPAFKKVPGTVLYRGMDLSKQAQKKLKNKQLVRLKNRPVTSWSLSKNVAGGFGSTVLQMPLSEGKNLVLLNVNSVFEAFSLRNYHKSEEEVLLLGSGVPKNIVKPQYVKDPGYDSYW